MALRSQLTALSGFNDSITKVGTRLELGHSVTEALDAIRWARPIAEISYALDAIDWYHCRHGSDDFERYSDLWTAHCWIKKFQTA